MPKWVTYFFNGPSLLKSFFCKQINDRYIPCDHFSEKNVQNSKQIFWPQTRWQVTIWIRFPNHHNIFLMCQMHRWARMSGWGGRLSLMLPPSPFKKFFKAYTPPKIFGWMKKKLYIGREGCWRDWMMTSQHRLVIDLINNSFKQSVSRI